MTTHHTPRSSSSRWRRPALLLGAAALIGMGGVTVACSTATDKPAETSVPTSVAPTEKAVRTNVTRAPEAAPAAPAHNGAVPCGYGPSGGALCGRHN